MNLRILLLQARNPDDPMKQQEIDCFARKAGGKAGEGRATIRGGDREQFVPWDLLQGPPSLATIRNHDALMVGGSGDYYVSKGNLPGFKRLLDVLGEVVEVGHPTFASCFGFQLLVAALGGEIVFDPDNTEVGTYELSLTEKGRADPLLGQLPPAFRAQVGRKERARALPDGVVHLAVSERCPFHGLRVPNKPIWATQFHPELNAEENLERFMRYLDGYSDHMTEEERTAAASRFQPSPDTEKLIRAFLELVFT